MHDERAQHHTAPARQRAVPEPAPGMADGHGVGVVLTDHGQHWYGDFCPACDLEREASD